MAALPLLLLLLLLCSCPPALSKAKTKGKLKGKRGKPMPPPSAPPPSGGVGNLPASQQLERAREIVYSDAAEALVILRGMEQAGALGSGETLMAAAVAHSVARPARTSAAWRTSARSD